jgi:hypothetical protein
MVAVLVIVLFIYINHFAKWSLKLAETPLTFKLVVLHALRIMGLISAFLNFFAYIVGSYFMTSNEYTASNMMLILMSIVVVACVIALMIVTNGFKDAILPVMRVRRGGFYDE